mgnify:CR=1 FL=1
MLSTSSVVATADACAPKPTRLDPFQFLFPGISRGTSTSAEDSPRYDGPVVRVDETAVAERAGKRSKWLLPGGWRLYKWRRHSIFRRDPSVSLPLLFGSRV